VDFLYIEANSLPLKRFYQFGSFRLDRQTRVLLRDGELVRIPPKAIDTLLVLLESAGQPVEKKTLIQSVWPDVFVEEHNLTHHISILRRTLGNVAGRRPHTETIPKRGYRFAGDVSEATESFGDNRGVTSPKAFNGPSATPTGQPATDALVAFTSFRFSRRKLAIALAASGLGVPAIVWWREHGSHALRLRTVVVLPFRNLSGDPNQDYVTDGITELLIGNLAHHSSLRVISRTSSMYFKNRVKKVAGHCA
jgi:DNA-binding winged helix-turn-helix (wHTH) protein